MMDGLKYVIMDDRKPLKASEANLYAKGILQDLTNRPGNSKIQKTGQGNVKQQNILRDITNVGVTSEIEVVAKLKNQIASYMATNKQLALYEFGRFVVEGRENSSSLAAINAQKLSVKGMQGKSMIVYLCVIK